MGDHTQYDTKDGCVLVLELHDVGELALFDHDAHLGERLGNCNTANDNDVTAISTSSDALKSLHVITV